MNETVLARIDLWTGGDTAEGGPTLSDVETGARIETAEYGAMLHTTSVDASGNLWTIALHLNRPDAAILARDLAAAAAGA